MPWVSEARAGGRRLDAARYAELAKPSKHVSPMTCGAVDPGLLEAVTAMTS